MRDEKNTCLSINSVRCFVCKRRCDDVIWSFLEGECSGLYFVGCALVYIYASKQGEKRESGYEYDDAKEIEATRHRKMLLLYTIGRGLSLFDRLKGLAIVRPALFQLQLPLYRRLKSGGKPPEGRFVTTTSAKKYRYPLFILVGGTGVGKGKLMDEVFNALTGLFHARSWTTRAPRNGESELAYFFVSQTVFREMIEAGRFLEYAQPFLADPVRPREDYYGRTAESFACLDRGPALCDMTEHGVRKLEELEAGGAFRMVVIRIEGQNMQSLERRDERAGADEERAAIPIRIDHTVVNDHGEGGLEIAVTRLVKIIQDELVMTT